MTENTNTQITKRLKRYGQVGGTLAGLVTKLAGERYFGVDIARPEHAETLTRALGNLKGPLMKIGQILATIPNALPPEYAENFRNLQSNAPPMGWSFVRRRMKTELGVNWQSKFQSFSQEPAAAASLGQVHKAITQDGIKTACKLQYPDMASAVDADINQLKLLFSIYKKYDKTIQTDEITAELTARLFEELDYILEAKHTRLYRHMLRDENHVHVPDVIDPLSTDRLLTTTWLVGENILEYKEAPQEQRNTLAMNMFRAWYVPLYHYGVIHGDPHLGNYTVREDVSLNLLDFGCIRVFPPAFIRGVILLYQGLLNNNLEFCVEAYQIWGFKNLSKEQIDILNIWAGFLYAPILEDKIRPIGEITDHGIYGHETARQVYQKLKKTGQVNIPREFIFMDRAALGLGSVFLHLKAEINWHRVFNDLISNFDEKALAARQKEALDRFDVPLYV